MSEAGGGEERGAELTRGAVREQITAEHKQLRRQLVELQLVARAAALDAEHTAELCRSLRALILDFELHLESEEAILLPLVEELAVFGPMRAAHMRGEHFTQRGMLHEMHERASNVADALGFAVEVDTLVLRLLEDMRGEEAEFLDPRVLHDEPHTEGQGAG